MTAHSAYPTPATAPAMRITTLVGGAADADLAERLHALQHQGVVERVHLSRTDMARRRQALRSDRGTDIALLLDRDATLENGSVLWLDDTRAIVVALDEPELLVLRPHHVARALEIGYFAGNMHWKVRFEGERLSIVLEGPREDYLQRLSALLRAGDVTVEPPRAPGHAHAHDHDHDHAHEHDHHHHHSHGR